MEFLTKNLLLSAYILEYFEFPIKIKNLKKILWQYSTVLLGDMIKMQNETNLHKHLEQILLFEIKYNVPTGNIISNISIVNIYPA